MSAPTTDLIPMGLGTGTVKKIAAGKNGQVLSIYFAAAVKIENGTGNIVLAQSGNFTAASGEVLVLVYNEAASAWVEVSRSVQANGTLTRAKLAGASVQTKRAAVSEIAAGSAAIVTVAWDSAFADTNYTVSLAVVVPGGVVNNESLSVLGITELTASQIKVGVRNGANVGKGLSGTLHAT